MKRVLGATAIACMVVGLTVAAYAAPDNSDVKNKGKSYRERVEQALANQKPLKGQKKGQKLKDQRVITPQMSYLERVEIMRDIKKRAAASRNALMNASNS